MTFMRWLIVLLASNVVGCARLQARRNNDVRSGYTVVLGQVRSADAPSGQRWAVLYKKGRHGWVRYSQFTFTRTWSFEFLCNAGTYRLVAFVDVDGDGKLGPAEPRVESDKLIEVAPGRHITNLHVSLAHGLKPVDFPVELPDPDRAFARHLVDLHVGDVASLDDARFGAEAGQLGYWQTAEFVKRHGMGISFLQPWEPGKTPVLFVHGAEGHPSEFTDFINGLDRTRFQPWVLSYASGAPLQVSSLMAQQLLEQLRERHHFESLHVVAHSMGGLLARDFITQLSHSAASRYVSTFVTFSSPWGGVAMAKVGVESAPSFVASWADVATDSDFLTTALERPLLARHYLFFSFEGGNGTDGVIALSSLLEERAQQQASLVYGFPATHTSILKNPSAVKLLNDVLLENE